ncbi:MAG: NUDIX domain-containing protein [Candidatus Acidiferrales bacterium]
MARKVATVVSSETVFSGRVFGVQRDEVVEPDGLRATREMVTHPGSVVVMPVFPNGDVLMVRQYRHSAEQYLWELVAGRKDTGESPLSGAKRELLEETGYAARRYKQMLDVYPTPGFVRERMWIFVAEGLLEGKAQPEEDEHIAVRRFPLPKVLKMIGTGKIHDAKSVAGILFYARFLRRK